MKTCTNKVTATVEGQAVSLTTLSYHEQRELIDAANDAKLTRMMKRADQFGLGDEAKRKMIEGLEGHSFGESLVEIIRTNPMLVIAVACDAANVDAESFERMAVNDRTMLAFRLCGFTQRLNDDGDEGDEPGNSGGGESSTPRS